MSAVKSSKVYTQIDPIDHILLRPDMYCGSKRFRDSDEYVSSEDNKIVKKDISYSPAMLRIFVEVLSNAIDNYKRSIGTKNPCTSIKVNINNETGEISIWNNGNIIPIEYNDTQSCYNHTLIFGKLLTGSNYDDEEDRVISGRNGLGSKLCNVFSSKFTVNAHDPDNKKNIEQVWCNNMKTTDGPVITDNITNTKGFTCIKWVTDFEQFKVKKFSNDVISLYKKFVIDCAMLCNDVRVFYNDERIGVNSLTSYASLYNIIDDKSEVKFIRHGDCEVVIVPSSDEFEAISFVNGVYTKLGGKHVDSWCETIFRPIVDKLNKKYKTNKIKFNISDVKQFFKVFIVCTVVRPEFDSQDKNKLESPDIKSSLTSSVIASIMKWNSFVSNIDQMVRTKEMLTLKKTEKTNSNSYIKIDGFDPANNACTKKSNECILIVCEGLSAKTYAVAGIQHGIYDKKGRDWFGILPLTGKILNVRNANISSISSNKVVSNLIKALNLKFELDYTVDKNYNTLNYGKLMIMTDADCDGIHIEGLLINLFHVLFPTILKRSSPYIVSMKTPIARVTKSKEPDRLFYDEKKFVDWMNSKDEDDKYKIKYYKGLGTTKIEDVPSTFGKKMVEYREDTNCNENMNKVFHKNYSDTRKKWLGDYDSNNSDSSLDDQGVFTNMDISSFIDNELIKFSQADCARSIPNFIDGLKESQRKILYCVIKRNLKFSGSSLKVAQLSGYTAEHSNYHHGEQNLQDTIIGMAHDFQGTNNIPLLYRDGQFGSRLDGGSDAASARYIFTKMDKLTSIIFKEEDEKLLTSVNDDGDLVQPEYYVPVIPMILVNGSLGIGTGWSSTIPCYNPKDIIDNIRLWIQYNKENIVDYKLNELTPWYRDSKCVIKKINPNKYISYGVIEQTNKVNHIRVTELPIGMWTNNFKETCEELLTSKQIAQFKNYSTPTTVDFLLVQKDDGILCNIENLRLYSYINTSNIVAFDENNKLNKFNSVEELLGSFCSVRLSYYIKRRNLQLSSIKSTISNLTNKFKFIINVINKKIRIMNKPETEIIQSITDAGIKMEDGSYEYLMRIQLRTMTEEKVNELKKQIEQLKITFEQINKTTPYELWERDLSDLYGKL